MTRLFQLAIFWPFLFMTNVIADDAIHRSIQDINQFLSPSDPLRDQQCNEKNTCPAVIQESSKDMYRTGTVGLINQIVSDGSLKNPRTVCQISAQGVKQVDIRKLQEQLDIRYPDTPKLYEYTQDCESIPAKEKGDQILHQAYMNYDFHFNNEALKTALINLLDSEAQINLVSADNVSECSEMRLAEVKKHCEELRSCKRERPGKAYLDIKSTEASFALESIRNLEAEKKKLMSGKVFKTDEVKEIEDNIETIKNLNPLLKGEKFRPLLKSSSVISKEAVDKAILGQLAISRKEIKKKIKSFNKAHDCLTGRSADCDDFEDTMRTTRYQSPSVTFPQSPELNSTANYHQCIQNIKQNRYEADDVLDGVAIDVALSLTPYAIVNGAKMAATLARTANAARKAANATRLTGKASMAANLGYGTYHTVDEYQQCTSAIEEFDKMGASVQKMSCNSIDKIFVNNSNNSQCVSRALVSSTFLGLGGLNSLALARHLPKFVPSKVSELVTKIRSGKSLTKEEELLLLQKLREKNPFDKIIVKKISTLDKKFAEDVLERLFKKEYVSPEDLIKLSRLIKPTNPPLLIITAQDNVLEIMESKRIWGSTEGSTYGAAKPIVSSWDRVKTGVLSDKEGTFIFTPEAAALFKPHEVEGLYSAMKRAAGQYKGPFGDIIIEEAKQVMINGRPHIIITKARRASDLTDEAQHIQSTEQARKRLWGRRAGIEPVAALGTAAPVLQMYSWISNKAIDEIVTDIFSED